MRDWPLIWCSNCGAETGLLIDEMEADNLNDHDAADLMCGECRLVIATLHDHKKDPV